MFYIDNVITLKSTSMASRNGIYDVVGATSKNNGNVGFLDSSYKSNVVNGNCICLIKTGQGSVGDAVYKQGEFIPSNNVCVIRSNWLNRYIALFIVAEINRQSGKYSYGYIRNLQRIEKETLMLPANSNSKPDFKFMEDFIKEREALKREQYLEYCTACLEKLGAQTDCHNIITKWGEFQIGKLFKVRRPKARSEKDYTLGDIPFVASGNFNNGVTKCCAISINEQIDRGNCITVSPVDGSSFYQSIDFLGRGGAGSSILLLYNDYINQYSGLFIAQMIRQTCAKYCYGKMGNKDSIKREKIMLPVDEFGNPDYVFMEQYTKAVITKKYNSYIGYCSGDCSQ